MSFSLPYEQGASSQRARTQRKIKAKDLRTDRKNGRFGAKDPENHMKVTERDEAGREQSL